jgi:hypothetical protein
MLFKRNSIIAFSLPKKSGTSTLIRRLLEFSSPKSKVIFVDLDEEFKIYTKIDYQSDLEDIEDAVEQIQVLGRPKLPPKTTLKRKNSSLDISVSKACNKVNLFPQAKEHVDKIKKDFEGYQLVLFSSNLELLKYLGTDLLYALCPSNRFITEDILPDMSKAQKIIFQSQVSQLYNRKTKVYIFEQFDDLMGITRKLLSI